MQDGTYPPRSFATLGPSEYSRRLRLVWLEAINNLLYFRRTGQTSDPIPHFTIWQSLVFLINSRIPLFCASLRDLNLLQPTLFRSYGISLPSSLDTIILLALVYSTSSPVSVCSTVWLDIFFNHGT